MLIVCIIVYIELHCRLLPFIFYIILFQKCFNVTHKLISKVKINYIRSKKDRSLIYIHIIKKTNYIILSGPPGI